MKINPNKKAPAYHEAVMEIYATPARIYKILSDINRWPEWQSDVKNAWISGRAEPGKNFTWKVGGFKIKSKIHTAEPDKAIGWTGNMWWIKAVHNWQLSPNEQSTFVKVKESLEGVGSGLMQKSLESGMAKSLLELKIEAEKEA